MEYTIIDDVDTIRRWIDSPKLERLEYQERLKADCLIFDASALSASNGKHFPFVNNPNSTLMKNIEDEIRQYLSEVTAKDYIKLKDMIKNKHSDDDILIFFSTLTGNKFGKCKVDKRYLKYARQLPSLADIVDYPEYRSNTISLAKEKIVEKTGDDYIKIHNTIASLLLSLDMLKRTVLERNKTVFQIIAENASLKYALRVVKSPIVIGEKRCNTGDVIIFNIARASNITKDIRFAFGQGTNERRCPFGFFMENFLQRLRDHADT